MKSARARSRFYPRDLTKLWAAKNPWDDAQGVNRSAHFAQHSPKTMPYTSTAAITTTVGSRFYPRFSGGIQGIRLNVQTAPSGAALTAVLLINGNTAATATIPDGSVYGRLTIPDIVHFTEDDYLQFQVTTVSGAGGPLLAALEYFTEG